MQVRTLEVKVGGSLSVQGWIIGAAGACVALEHFVIQNTRVWSQEPHWFIYLCPLTPLPHFF